MDATNNNNNNSNNNYTSNNNSNNFDNSIQLSDSFSPGLHKQRRKVRAQHKQEEQQQHPVEQFQPIQEQEQEQAVSQELLSTTSRRNSSGGSRNGGGVSVSGNNSTVSGNGSQTFIGNSVNNGAGGGAGGSVTMRNSTSNLGVGSVSSSKRLGGSNNPQSITSSFRLKKKREEEAKQKERYSLWYWMIKMPYPFMFVLPVIYCFFAGFGWVGDDDVEESMNQIWVPTTGSLYKNSQYLEALGRPRYDTSAFAALARVREPEQDGAGATTTDSSGGGTGTSDDTNIFTPERLELIRKRMEETERTTITYNNVTYKWEDLCAFTPKPYSVPCVRLSAMDFFYEARWYFDENTDHFTSSPRLVWYNDFIRQGLMKPLVSRYSILEAVCSPVSASGKRGTDVCADLIEYRTGDPNSTSYDPIALLGDVLSLELSNECRICIEANYTSVLLALYETTRTSFGILQAEVERSIDQNGLFLSIFLPEALEKAKNISAKIRTIRKSLSLKDVEEFYYYYGIRNMYATLGAETYLENYARLQELFETCHLTGSLLGFTYCPPIFINGTTDAQKALYNHADHLFSSITTAGSPFPMWGEPGDGTTFMLMGSSPVGGSGVNMSSGITSIITYLDADNYNPPESNKTTNETGTSNATSTNATDTNTTGGTNVTGTDATGTNATSVNATTSSNVTSTNVTDNNNTEQDTNIGADDRDNKVAWLPLYGNNSFVDVSSEAWKAFVEANPMYAWFMASLEPADYICGNGNLTGTNTSNAAADNRTREVAILATGYWCNNYSIPNEDNPGTGNYTKQYFAKLWYDKLVDSPGILDVQQGVDDPYTWTLGIGCGYSLAGERSRYTNTPIESILYNASRELYLYDEGSTVGVISPEVLIGDMFPVIGEYSFEKPLQHVGVVQTIYQTLIPDGIVNRVGRCDRPGGPINISKDDARKVLFEFKIAMENVWSRDWDNGTDDVQFVGYFDDSGAIGTAGRMLRTVTLDNTSLMVLSTMLIAAFSIAFLFSFDLVESRVLIMIVGIMLIVLGYFAGLGFAVIVGTKINVVIGWTLPFLLIGLGVDNLYIILTALRKQQGFSEQDFKQAMRETVVPVTMTSLVNASMFAVMNISDIPAVHITARVAIYCLIFLYLAVVFCFPAYCYLDMKRQAAGRYDIFLCYKKTGNEMDNFTPTHITDDFRSKILYDYCFKQLVLGENKICRIFSHLLIMAGTVALVGVGSWGITKREIGIGLEDFFPSTNQAHVWAAVRTEALQSWSINVAWGRNAYTDSDVQMQMLKQVEDIAATRYIADIDTKQVWIAEFSLWASRLCESNIGQTDFQSPRCGRDQIFKEEDSACEATWSVNIYGLREKVISEFDDNVCLAREGGICRPAYQMHPEDMRDIFIADPLLEVNATTSFCPTIKDWSLQKWSFCLKQWRNLTGSTNGGFILAGEHGSETECDGVYNNDQTVILPILLSFGPPMFAYNLSSHEETIDMIRATRPYCEDNESIRCWVQGSPIDYWTQYETILTVLAELCGYSILVGFLISFIFLYVKISYEGRHERPRILLGSLIGATMIACTCAFTLIAVIGLSILAGVNITGFSAMSFVLSIGFSVEYSVHIVARWLRTDLTERTSLERIRSTMSYLMLPTFMSFVSSTIGVVCLSFSYLEYIRVYFFRPLMILMFVAYYIGCWWLPVALTYIDLESVKLGKAGVKGAKRFGQQSTEEDEMIEEGDCAGGEQNR